MKALMDSLLGAPTKGGRVLQGSSDTSQHNEKFLSVVQVLMKPPEERIDRDLQLIAPFVKELNFFKYKKLKAQDITYLCAELQYEFYKKGETIFNFGETGNKFYIIIKGQVDIRVPDQKTREKILTAATIQSQLASKKGGMQSKFRNVLKPPLMSQQTFIKPSIGDALMMTAKPLIPTGKSPFITQNDPGSPAESTPQEKVYEETPKASEVKKPPQLSGLALLLKGQNANKINMFGGQQLSVTPGLPKTTLFGSQQSPGLTPGLPKGKLLGAQSPGLSPGLPKDSIGTPKANGRSVTKNGFESSSSTVLSKFMPNQNLATSTSSPHQAASPQIQTEQAQAAPKLPNFIVMLQMHVAAIKKKEEEQKKTVEADVEGYGVHIKTSIYTSVRKFFVKHEEEKALAKTLFSKTELNNSRFQSVASLTDGQTFGELALLQNKPRMATVRCTSHTHLMVLTKAAFDEVIGKMEKRILTEKINFLGNIPVFSRLTRNTLAKITFGLVKNRIARDQILYKEGDPAKSVFFVISGELQATKTLIFKIEVPENTKEIFKDPLRASKKTQIDKYKKQARFTTKKTNVRPFKN